MVVEVHHHTQSRQLHYANRRVRRGKGRLAEYLDSFLDGRGYFRKQTAKDASCIFRAVSEQLFYSQRFHTSVRLACVRFMRRNHDLLAAKFGTDGLTYEMERMRSPREWVTIYEIEAMSLLYKRDFIVFEGDKEIATSLTNNNFSQKIVLCQLGKNHHDSLFTKTYIEHAAMCQSIAYEILYSGVFGIADLDKAVKSMLYTIPSSLSRRNKTDGSLVPARGQTTASTTPSRGSTPFPYKVAKALDCFTYRNIEFDMWVSELRESRRNAKFRNEVLQIGSKCLVTLPESDGHQYFAYIQEMLPNGGPVCVFVEGLGIRCIVDATAIETLQTIPVGRRDGKHQRVDIQRRNSSYSNCGGKVNKGDSGFFKSVNSSSSVRESEAAFCAGGSTATGTEPTQIETCCYDNPDPDNSALVPYGTSAAVVTGPYAPQDAVLPKAPVYVVLPPTWPLGAPLPVVVTYLDGQTAPVLVPQNILYPLYPGFQQQAAPHQDLATEQQEQPLYETLKSQETLTHNLPGFIQSYEGQPLFHSKWNDPYTGNHENFHQPDEHLHLMPYEAQHYPLLLGQPHSYPAPDGYPAICNSGPVPNCAGP